MRVIVTGGSGYLGVHVRSFFDAGNFSRRSGFDILHPTDLEDLRSYDLVIHLAAHLDKDPAAAELCFRTNAEGTANVIRHIKPGAVLIYASTKDVYGANANFYQEVPESCPTDYTGQSALEWSKLLGERYLDYYARRRGVRVCIFRMSTVYARHSDGNEYGFVTHYVESIKHGWPIRLACKGLPVRDVLHVDDFSRACQAFVQSGRDFGLYNLGGGSENSATLREIADRIGKMIQLPVIAEDDQHQPVPFNYISDLSRIRTELNWRPQMGLDEGLRSLL
jgi:nucleoside-diphosphate-sugar epimerase